MSVVYLNLAEELVDGGDWAQRPSAYKRHRDLLGRLIAEFPTTYRDQLRMAFPSFSNELQQRAGLMRPSANRPESSHCRGTAPRQPRHPHFCRPNHSIGTAGSEHRDLADMLVAAGDGSPRPFPSTPRASQSWKTQSGIFSPWMSMPRCGLFTCDARAKAQAKLDETSRARRVHPGGSRLPFESLGRSQTMNAVRPTKRGNRFPSKPRRLRPRYRKRGTLRLLPEWRAAPRHVIADGQRNRQSPAEK